MKLCWVTNQKKYSKLFRYLFNEDASHMGIIFNINGIDLVIDLNRPHGTLWDLNYWQHRYTIVRYMEVKLSEEEELWLFKSCKGYAVLRKYDMSGYFYGMVCGILNKILGVPLPDENKWSDGSGSMCQQIVIPLMSHPVIKNKISNLELIQNTAAKSPKAIQNSLEIITKDNEHVIWYENMSWWPI